MNQCFGAGGRPSFEGSDTETYRHVLRDLRLGVGDAGFLYVLTRYLGHAHTFLGRGARQDDGEFFAAVTRDKVP